MFRIDNTVTTTLDYLDLIVQTLHETARMPTAEVIGNLVFSRLQCLYEIVEAAKSAPSYTLHPTVQPSFGLRLGHLFVENGRQFVPEGVRLFQRRRVPEELIQDFLVFWTLDKITRSLDGNRLSH